MTSRRYWLRFESGARAGERVPLSEAVSTVGRRPGNTIQVADASVSGRHAELRLEGPGVVLADLGSTNGTRVGNDKVTERALAHGDAVFFGKVRAVFEDAELGGPPAAADDVVVLEEEDDDEIQILEEPAAKPMPGTKVPARDPLEPTRAPAAATATRASASSAADAGALESVSAERLAASGSRSWIAPALLAAILVAAGVFGWRLWSARGAAVERDAVPALVGNLLPDHSFEDPEAPAWVSAEEGPESFYLDRGFALSGSVGLGCELEDGAWALARSAEVALPARTAVELTAELSASGGALGRVGLELSSVSGEVPTFVAWAPARRATDGFASVSLVLEVPPEYDRGRAVVAGHAPAAGAVALDDVGLVEGGQPAAPVRFEEYELRVLGDPGTTALFLRSGRVLGALDLAPWAGTPGSGWAEGSWTAAGLENGVELVLAGPAPERARAGLVFVGDRALEGDGGEPRIATIGPEGYRAQSSAFEAEAVVDVLGGRGVNLIRLGLGSPQPVVFARRDDHARLRFGIGGLDRVVLQLGFGAERLEADRLARGARDAERGGRPGAAIATWTDLLDRFPYEAELIDEAEAARARLSAAGYERTEEVRREVERARFFALADIFAECRARAEEVAEAWAGSPTEEDARALVREIDEAVASLHSGRRGDERRLLEGVLEALAGEEAPELSAHVAATLGEAPEEGQD